MDDQVLAAYLSRIEVTGPVAADQRTLRELHQAHQRTVPFENLSIFLGEAISLTDADLIDKIVTRRRGGFCYELNGAFALLLEAIGFTVSRVAARVYGKDGLGPPFDHLALIVTTAEGSGESRPLHPRPPPGPVRPMATDRGWPTSGSAATATIRCCSMNAVSSPTRPGRSSLTAPSTATSRLPRTASPSTGSSAGPAT
jgi:hypothetical protein